MNNAIIYLHNIQNEYYNILKSKEQIVFSDDLNLVEITMIIEEIDIFWRKNRDKILFDLDYFDDKETLFLAGSMYLDIDDNCHYYFKTFGDENIINDPILKFQNIANNDVNATFDIISIFKRSFKNTLSLLENFSSYFYILPVDYIISVYNDELIEMKNKIFYQLLSSLLDCEDILSNELFFETFDSIDEIENILENKKIDLFTFNEGDNNLSLKERLDKYETQIPFKFDDYLMKFSCLLYNSWNQIISIFLVFIEIGFIPYISFKNTFFNFHTLFLSLYNGEDADEILNKIIVFYTFNICTDESIFNEIPFEDYVNLVKNNNFQEKLMNNNDDNISKGLGVMINHISKEFNALIEKNEN